MIKKSFNLAFFILSLLILFSCASDLIEEEGDGNVTIITPDYAPLNKSIYGLTKSEVQSLQGSVRYEIVVEHEERIIKTVVLENDEETTISLPSGINLNIGVGIYLAESSSNDDEVINSYLVTDLKRNIELIANQTIYIDFTLDYSNPTVVDYHYDYDGSTEAPGMADITGGIMYDDGTNSIPVFTTKSLLNSNFNMVEYDGSDLIDFSDTVSGFTTSEGKMFEVDYPGNNVYWYLTNSDVYLIDAAPVSSALTLSTRPTTDATMLDSDAISELKNVYRIESVYYDGPTTDFYYYFLIHEDGMLSTRYRSDTTDWSQVSIVDFSQFSSIYPNLPFILDIEKNYDDDGENTFFASKIGAFFIDHICLDYFADEMYDDAVNRLKRMIRIPDPKYPETKSILITSVKSIPSHKYVYLGTRSGLYRIDQTSSKWNSFKNESPSGDFVILDEDSIEKMGNFKNDPIIALESNGSNILAVATANKVWFKNLSNGNTKTLTVWDGLPFIPRRDLDYEPDYNDVDFENHGISPVRFILWDDTNNMFWIGTKHGLGSISENDIF